MDLIERDPTSGPVQSRPGPRLEDMVLNAPFAAPPAEAENGIMMRLRRRKLLFSTVFLGVLGLVGGAFMYLPATYKAEASVTIAAPDRVLSSQQVSDTQQIGDSSDLESQAVILSSPMLIRELLTQPAIRTALMQECEASQPPEWKKSLKALLQRPPAPSCATQLDDTTGMVGSIRGRLAVATNGRSRVINVSFTSPLPEVAQAVANGIVQGYLDAQTRDKLRPRDEAIEWLRDETKRIADRLKFNEAKIASFLQAKGVVKGQLAPIASEQLTGLSQQLALAEADRATAAGRMQQTRSQGGATSSALENRNIGDVKQQLATVTSQLAQMSARYGSSNPALTELQEQRRGLERLLSQETSLVTRSTVADYQAASSRVTSLRAQVDALKQDVRGNDNATTQVAALQRDAVTDRELYLDLTKNLNALETNRRLVTANARLVSLAELPESVFFPKPSTFGLTGLLLATAFATVAALVRDRSDRTLKAVDGLQGSLGLRVLAHIPHVARVGRGSSQMEKRIQQPSAFQEAIRSLYAECLLVSARRHGGERPVRSIMVSSSDSGEGKSFITLALAHFAASAGQRVLVLECDLRRPSIGRSLSLPGQQGITEILRGVATPEQVVCEAPSGRLDVILAGKPAMDSTELMGNPRLRQLLAWANTRYDLVLIDTPPSRALPDARILAPDVDGVLYCAQWGRSHTDAVVNGVSEIRAAGGRMLGLVLDRVTQEHYRHYDTKSLKSGSYLVAQGR
jgi:succinoglycan biosynthesis transport protein ExoP